MSERLLIRLHPDGQLAWLAQDAGGRALSPANSGAPPPATLARARRIVVLVPGEDVLLLETDAVSTRRAQLLKAVPFALEDQLVSPVEDLHFALPERVERGRIGVAVVARERLRAWVQQLSALGIRPDVLLPDTLALPLPADAASLCIEPRRALLRCGPAQAFACELPLLADWLGVAAATALVVHDFRQAAALALPVRALEYHERQTDALAFFAAHLPREPEPNLLQGEFSPSHRHLPLRRLWTRAAALAAAALVLALAHAGIDWLRLARESARLDAEQRDVLRGALPQLAQVAGDPRQVMQSALTRLSVDAGGSGVIALLNRIGPVLASMTRVSLKGIEYRNATLELALRAPDVPALDLVRERLASLGLNVEVTSANSGEAGVDGRLRIGGAGT